MKRVRLVFVLLLIAAMLCGCAELRYAVDFIKHNYLGYYGPPPLPFFTMESVAEVEACLNAENMTDAQVEAFISEHQVGMGLDNREDMEAASQVLQTIGYPMVEGEFDNLRFEVCPDVGEYEVTYRIDWIRYRFRYKVFEAYITSWLYWPVGTYKIDDVEFRMYKGGDNNIGGVIYANGYEISVSVANYEDLSDISFEPFSWSTDMELMR